MIAHAAMVRLWALASVISATWEASAYQCRTDIDLGPAMHAERKGIALDDNTLRWCSSQIPDRWPNAQQPMTSIRLFKAWDPLWNDWDRAVAWANLEAYVLRVNAKVFIGTQITCDEAADERAWGWTKELISRLSQEHVMGLAIGNELELLQFKGPGLVSPSCVDNVWEQGYLWRQFQRFTAEFDSLGFSSVPVTSVFTGLGLAGVDDEPFYEKPGKARVNSFIANATQAYGSRFAFTWNFYPYFDPNFHPDAGTSDQCNDVLAHAICWHSDCNVPRLVREARTRQRWMTGNSDAKLWIGETGWSSPMASTLETKMKHCEAWSSLQTFRRFYDDFLHWDMYVGRDLAPPDHVFWFTMRDSSNFGSGEHFGLISTCDDPKCKVHTAGYQPLKYIRHNGPSQHYCGDHALYDGWAFGEQNCQAKCTLEAKCNYYGIWPLSHDRQHWCRLTTTCDEKAETVHWVRTYQKMAKSTSTTTEAPPSQGPSTGGPTTQVSSTLVSTTQSQTSLPPSTSTTRIARDPVEASTTPVTTSSPPAQTSTALPSSTQATTVAVPVTRTSTPDPVTRGPTTQSSSTSTTATATTTTTTTTTTSATAIAASTTQTPASVPSTTAPSSTGVASTTATSSIESMPSQTSTTDLATTQLPSHPNGCEFELVPLFPGFFWDTSCELGMLGCNADGINVQCRFCGGGSYLNISCPSTSCTFAQEPFVPYYWDENCNAGIDGCWADGIHPQCRFCGRFPYTNIPCPEAPAPPAARTRGAACTFETIPRTPFFVDLSCRHGMKGCLADALHMSCRFCGEGEYADIPCPEGPASKQCSFAVEPTTPYYWEADCHMGMLGCMADGVHPECRFCAMRPFEDIPCPEPYAPAVGQCQFPANREPEIAHYWEPDCELGTVGCWADGIHSECRFCGTGVYRDITCPDAELLGSNSTSHGPSTTASTGDEQEVVQRAPGIARPDVLPAPREDLPHWSTSRMPSMIPSAVQRAPGIASPEVVPVPREDLLHKDLRDQAADNSTEDDVSGSPRLAGFGRGIALVCWLGGAISRH